MGQTTTLTLQLTDAQVEALAGYMAEPLGRWSTKQVDDFDDAMFDAVQKTGSYTCPVPSDPRDKRYLVGLTRRLVAPYRWELRETDDSIIVTKTS